MTAERLFADTSCRFTVISFAVRAVEAWRSRELSDGSVFRRVAKSNRPVRTGSINQLVQQAVARAGIDPLPYSTHSLRAGFVTRRRLPS